MGTPPPLSAPGYERLASVLSDAFDHAAHGKGKERHACGRPFHEQPMQRIIEMHGLAFGTGQAAKKSQEAHRLPFEMARSELLGAINYLAGSLIHLENLEAARVMQEMNSPDHLDFQLPPPITELAEGEPGPIVRVPERGCGHDCRDIYCDGCKVTGYREITPAPGCPSIGGICRDGCTTLCKFGVPSNG